MTARELWARTLGRLRRSAVEDELDEEIAAHLELAVEENLQRGMTPEDARRAASLQFGAIDGAKEEVRDQLGLPALDSLARDARYAIRGLRRAPGFTFVATATLALGIGICSAFFSVLNGVLLKEAPGIADPDRLFATERPIAYPYFENFRAQNEIARDTAAWIGSVTFSVALGGPGEGRAERMTGHIVSQATFGRWAWSRAWGAFSTGKARK